jgi:hypothetical protein
MKRRAKEDADRMRHPQSELMSERDGEGAGDELFQPRHSRSAYSSALVITR